MLFTNSGENYDLVTQQMTTILLSQKTKEEPFFNALLSKTVLIRLNYA